jgi:hypothetical protein
MPRLLLFIRCLALSLVYLSLSPVYLSLSRKDAGHPCGTLAGPLWAFWIK